MQQPQASHVSTIDLQVGSLILELTELRNRKGTVNIALFSSEDGFPKDATKAVRSGSYPISELPLAIEFSDLPYGCYAVSVHHDENLDGKINFNALGIPKEGIGFSGNPKIWKGAPGFQRAAFEFNPRSRQVSITMKYLLP